MKSDDAKMFERIQGMIRSRPMMILIARQPPPPKDYGRRMDSEQLVRDLARARGEPEPRTDVIFVDYLGLL